GAAFGWRAALNFTDAEIGGLRPAQAPEWSASGGFDWRFGNGATIAADIVHESERFEDDLNSRRLAPATIVDLRLEQELTATLFVYAAVDNALDAAVETAESADGVESFGAPRTARLGLRVRLP
ncbi:MAG TPA: TonB-dependent receptor, partial [Hyphomonadaceae bacterium]|nr:TonB-dependent receptor [Hyphomonadaceae bacterium]